MVLRDKDGRGRWTYGSSYHGVRVFGVVVSHTDVVFGPFIAPTGIAMAKDPAGFTSYG